jgi:DNA-binding response OmpR family regulator
MPVERVLVADDDAALRNLLVLICRRAGFEVDIARDGAQALQAIANTEYLLVILDLQMPNTNGFDVVEALRARRRRPSVVVVTALPPSEVVGLDPAVVQAVVRKPFDVDLLTLMMAELAAAARQEWMAAAAQDADNNSIAPN